MVSSCMQLVSSPAAAVAVRFALLQESAAGWQAVAAMNRGFHCHSQTLFAEVVQMPMGLQLLWMLSSFVAMQQGGMPLSHWNCMAYFQTCREAATLWCCPHTQCNELDSVVH